MKSALALGVVLICFSNGLGLFLHVSGIERESVYVPATVVLLLASLFWARGSARLTWAEMGLRGDEWRSSAITGALSGLALALLLIAFLSYPFVLAAPIHYGEIQNLDGPGLLWRLGVELTVATALAEEVLFRGILQALFKRALSLRLALVSTNVVFALWHLWINAQSVQQNQIALPLIPADAAQVLGYLGSLLAVGIGGGILSILRERTNHLAGSIALHWVAVAAMTVLIYLR